MEEPPNPNKLIDQYNSSLDFQDQETKEANRITFEGHKMELERIKTYTTLTVSSLTAILLAEILSESTIISNASDYIQYGIYIYLFCVILILLLSLAYWKIETYFWFTVGNGRFINGKLSHNESLLKLQNLPFALIKGVDNKEKHLNKMNDYIKSLKIERDRSVDNQDILAKWARKISWAFDFSFLMISISFVVMIFLLVYDKFSN
jgi:hypothetical protein